MSHQEEKDNLRRLFKIKYPDVSKITQTDIHRLIYILDDELDKFYYQGDHLRMYMQPMNRYVANMIREKGIVYKGLELHVLSHYFSNREAVTFTSDGNVYFCGWAGGCNHDPFINGFLRWLS